MTILYFSGKLYSWGDGDYGKLGRGGSDGSKVPRLIEKLQNVNIINIYCGPHFSVALSKDGQVYTWGKVFIFYNELIFCVIL